MRTLLFAIFAFTTNASRVAELYAAKYGETSIADVVEVNDYVSAISSIDTVNHPVSEITAPVSTDIYAHRNVGTPSQYYALSHSGTAPLHLASQSGSPYTPNYPASNPTADPANHSVDLGSSGSTVAPSSNFNAGQQSYDDSCCYVCCLSSTSTRRSNGPQLFGSYEYGPYYGTDGQAHYGLYKRPGVYDVATGSHNPNDGTPFGDGACCFGCPPIDCHSCEHCFRPCAHGCQAIGNANCAQCCQPCQQALECIGNLNCAPLCESCRQVTECIEPVGRACEQGIACVGPVIRQVGPCVFEVLTGIVNLLDCLLGGGERRD